MPSAWVCSSRSDATLHADSQSYSSQVPGNPTTIPADVPVALHRDLVGQGTSRVSTCPPPLPGTCESSQPGSCSPSAVGPVSLSFKLKLPHAHLSALKP